jgi:4-hydroxythreonine-4-phosphate dehydrogenase
MKNKAILIVAGEPNSVFLEIFFKSIEKKNFKKPIILIVSKKLLLNQMRILNFNYKVKTIDENYLKLNKLDNKSINIINVNYNFKKAFEKISSKSNKYIHNCFDIALKILSKNKDINLINGPISKRFFLRGSDLGITEYLANKKNINNVVMLIYNKKLSVSPVTTHLPIKDVHKKISKEKIINQVIQIHKFYKKVLKRNPRIAITGLNPHCESNYISSEEDKTIIPAIKALNKKKNLVKGPFPADTIFMKDNLKKYDVIIGMYHDQVLSPIKTLFGFNAINITLGLPFIRISPDHGPNTLMLGKNRSNPTSLIEALKFLNK